MSIAEEPATEDGVSRGEIGAAMAFEMLFNALPAAAVVDGLGRVDDILEVGGLYHRIRKFDRLRDHLSQLIRVGKTGKRE